MKNPTNTKHAITAEDTTDTRKRKKQPAIVTAPGGDTLYLEDLEENGPQDCDWEARAACCGGPLSVIWQRGTDTLILCCRNCRLVLLRFVLARRPLAAAAGAAIDGEGGQEC